MNIMTTSIISIFALSTALQSVNGQHVLPKLPYDYAALEPYIDSNTMNIHYNNHHAAYVNNLNKALENKEVAGKENIVSLLSNLEAVPADIRTTVRNNGGGHYNHTLFWSLLAPAGSTKISPVVEKALNEAFGSVDAFKAEFEKAATTRFGSGWAWLIKNSEGKLQIISTPNQDNPIMSVAEVKGTPVLAIDVWEHAYYLKYQSKRADYVKAFWNVVNWNEVEKRLK